ncbi:hypothetical protein [Virgibacillus dakarensis]|uniref:hypothetical protein n=1 Tax=Virgibacillus dakarensis TaxID=1917889 RepID=UPI000B439972|nr:hypothetical protein [Virgibacillus dakarensis]
MKKIEWLIAALLIAAGLICLTVSATTIWGTESIVSYFKTFVQLCLWTGLPFLIIGIVYFILLLKRKDK